MSDQVNVRITPALHPETVRAIDGYNEQTAIYVADVVSAFNDAYATLGKVHLLADAAKLNDTWTPENKILVVSKEAAKHQERLLRKMDICSRDLAKGIAHIDGELTQPLKEQANLGNLNIEVRSHFKGLSRADRSKLVREAFASGDDATLTAVLGAQSFLSGMASEEHAEHVRRYHEKQNPHLVARLKVMRSALDKLDRDASKVLTEMQKAIGAKPNQVNAISNANQRALDAMRIDPA